MGQPQTGGKSGLSIIDKPVNTQKELAKIANVKTGTYTPSFIQGKERMTLSKGRGNKEKGLSKLDKP
jgi:hypothetical protein